MTAKALYLPGAISSFTKLEVSTDELFYYFLLTSENFIKQNLTGIPIYDTEQMKGGCFDQRLLSLLSPGPSPSSTSGCVLGNLGLLGMWLGTLWSG